MKSVKKEYFHKQNRFLQHNRLLIIAPNTFQVEQSHIFSLIRRPALFHFQERKNTEQVKKENNISRQTHILTMENPHNSHSIFVVEYFQRERDCFFLRRNEAVNFRLVALRYLISDKYIVLFCCCCHAAVHGKIKDIRIGLTYILLL